MEKKESKMMMSSSSSNSSSDEVVMDDDQILLLSQLYPDLYTNHQLHQKQDDDESKSSRKRRRKSSSSSSSSINEMSMKCMMNKKRKLSSEQVKLLEMSFGNEHKLESERKDKIALELGLDPRQVAVWFQNRRARWKNKKLEEEYAKLKSAHDGVIVDKCRLEAEVMKLKQQLCETQKQIQKLSLSHDPPTDEYEYDDHYNMILRGTQTNINTSTPTSTSSSSTSSFSHNHFPGDHNFDIHGFDDQTLLYYWPAEYDHWLNLYHAFN